MHVVSESEGSTQRSPNSHTLEASIVFEFTWIESLESRNDKLP
jgi:hypothetical protein